VADEQPVRENLRLIDDVQGRYPVTGVVGAVREELEEGWARSHRLG